MVAHTLFKSSAIGLSSQFKKKEMPRIFLKVQVSVLPMFVGIVANASEFALHFVGATWNVNT